MSPVYGPTSGPEPAGERWDADEGRDWVADAGNDPPDAWDSEPGEWGSEPGEWGSEPGEWGGEPGEWGGEPGRKGAGAARDEPNPWGSSSAESGKPGEDGWGEAESTDPGRGADAARAPAPAATRNLTLRLAAVLTAAVAAFVLIVVVATRGGGNGEPNAAGTQAAPTVPPGFIDSARLDSDPVVEGEFFGAARITVSGNVYRRLAVQLDDGCPQLSGTLPGIVADDRCRQLVRALYVTEPAEGQRQILVGLSVFVVDHKTTAQAAQDAAAKGAGGVTPLPVPQDSVPGIRITGPAGDNSWRAATTRGHYMIFMQAAYVDGSEGAATDEQLRNTIADMQMVAIDPIATRTIEGHGLRGTTPPAPSSPTSSPAS